jgi:hypothetical protein
MATILLIAEQSLITQNQSCVKFIMDNQSCFYNQIIFYKAKLLISKGLMKHCNREYFNRPPSIMATRGLEKYTNRVSNGGGSLLMYRDSADDSMGKIDNVFEVSVQQPFLSL